MYRVINIYIWTPAPFTLPRSRCTCGVKNTETRAELSTTRYLQSKLMSRCLSAPDATSLPTSLLQEQTAKIKVVRIQQKEYLVLCTDFWYLLFTKYLSTALLFTKYLSSTNVPTALLFTKYLSSTNVPTAQQKKGHKYFLSDTTQIREALLYVISKSLQLYSNI